MRDESDDFLGFVFLTSPIPPFLKCLALLSCLTALTACPTSSKKRPSAFPNCVPIFSCNSQGSASLLDGTSPPGTLPKALIFPH